MVAKNVNLKIMRGDTYTIGIRIKGLGQVPDSVYFSCKRNFEDQEYLFQKSLSDGISVENLQDSIRYAVKIAPNDTKNALAPQRYQYDLEATINGDVVTLLTGRLELVPDVTKH